MQVAGSVLKVLKKLKNIYSFERRGLDLSNKRGFWTSGGE